MKNMLSLVAREPIFNKAEMHTTYDCLHQPDGTAGHFEEIYDQRVYDLHWYGDASVAERHWIDKMDDLQGTVEIKDKCHDTIVTIETKNGQEISRCANLYDLYDSYGRHLTAELYVDYIITGSNGKQYFVRQVHRQTNHGENHTWISSVCRLKSGIKLWAKRLMKVG